MQVFGLFAVTATATGSLYFLDATRVASTSGLDAAGVLLLMLNLAYLLVLGVAIASAASLAVRIFVKKHYNKGVSRVHAVLQGQRWQQM